MADNSPSINPQELRALDRAIGDLALLSGRSINSVMRQLIPRVARSAAKATKPNGSVEKVVSTPKNRPKRDIRGRLLGKRKAGEVPWWADYALTVYKQGRGGEGIKRTLYVTEERLSKYIRIPNRGVAKAAWIGAIPSALSNSLRGAANGVPGAKRYSQGRLVRERGQIVGAKMENRVRYNTKAGPNADSVALRKQANWLGNAIKREEAKIASKFRSSARRAIGGLI